MATESDKVLSKHGKGATILDPHEYLRYASKYPSEVLAEKTGVSVRIVRERIREADRRVAKLDGRFVSEVFWDFDQDQLANKIIKDVEELKAVSNAHANQRLSQRKKSSEIPSIVRNPMTRRLSK